jgi:hypothetical protein
MDAALADLLHRWHDFYVLIGTAAATLVGLVVVAVSIGTQIFGREHTEPVRAFISPTVVHFSAVLFSALVAMIPSHTRASFAGVMIFGGLAGTAYVGRVLYQLFVSGRFKVDVRDRFFYALIPLAGYALMLGSGILLLLRWPGPFEFTAAALLMLLAAGIRNAWDMTVWIVLRTPTGGEGAQRDG